METASGRSRSARRRTYARGVGYWKDGDEERIITITPGMRLVALDLKTGTPVPTFGQKGTVDLFESLDLDFSGDLIGRIGNSSPPVVSNGVIMVGPALTPNTPSYHNVKGDVMGFDARTGKKLWRSTRFREKANSDTTPG